MLTLEKAKQSPNQILYKNALNVKQTDVWSMMGLRLDVIKAIKAITYNIFLYVIRSYKY